LVCDAAASLYRAGIDCSAITSSLAVNSCVPMVRARVLVSPTHPSVVISYFQFASGDENNFIFSFSQELTGTASLFTHDLIRIQANTAHCITTPELSVQCMQSEAQDNHCHSAAALFANPKDHFYISKKQKQE
jgi:hypothetical protein